PVSIHVFSKLLDPPNSVTLYLRSPWINIVCPQVAYSHRSGKLNVPRMIIAETPLIRLYLETCPVHTVPSFSYNRLVQLKHTQLWHHAFQYTHTLSGRLSLIRHIFLRFLLSSILSSP
ncbi:unnamed protein product, partial [Hymenolepis diminuta]